MSILIGSNRVAEDILSKLERSLSLQPEDEALSVRYIAELERLFGHDIPVGEWLTKHYLDSLKSQFRNPAPLNALGRFYTSHNQAFNSMLCFLASLAADPKQDNVHDEVRTAYDQGVPTPRPYIPNEPITCKVSVILATKNRPGQFRAAIQSVLAQTFIDYEVLIINDGGTQEAEEIASSFGSPKIRYFYKEPGGHRSAMNFGLSVARGKYIAYLDDDDIYFPNHLEILVDAAEQGQLDFVCGRNRWVVGRWENDKWIEDKDLTKQEPFSLDRLHVSAVIADLDVLHTRSLAERVGLFWEEPPRGGEWEYWVRCSHETTIKRLDEVTCEVRVIDSLPANQPARARFFNELWVNYFGSAFGEAILALAAFRNNDTEEWRMLVGTLSSKRLFLRHVLFVRLWAALVEDGSSDCRRLMRQMAQQDPVSTLQATLDATKEIGSQRVLLRTPVLAYLSVAGYALKHPRYSWSRLLRFVDSHRINGNS